MNYWTLIPAIVTAGLGVYVYVWRQRREMVSRLISSAEGLHAKINTRTSVYLKSVSELDCELIDYRCNAAIASVHGLSELVAKADEYVSAMLTWQRSIARSKRLRPADKYEPGARAQRDGGYGTAMEASDKHRENVFKKRKVLWSEAERKLPFVSFSPPKVGNGEEMEE